MQINRPYNPKQNKIKLKFFLRTLKKSTELKLIYQRKNNNKKLFLKCQKESVCELVSNVYE